MDSGGLVNRVLLAPFGLPMEPKNYSHDEKIRIIQKDTTLSIMYTIFIPHSTKLTLVSTRA